MFARIEQKKSEKMRIFLAAFAASLFLLGAPPASADSGFSSANRVYLREGHPESLALRTAYGVLTSNDDGHTWDWLCPRAMGATGWRAPVLAFREDGRIVSGLFEGLKVSSDSGCSWGFYPALKGEVIADLASAPWSSQALFALSGTFVETDDAGVSQYRSQIFRSLDNTNWELYGSSIPSDVVVVTFAFAKTDPTRVYLSGMRGRGTATTAHLFVSKDSGVHWNESLLPIDPYSQGVPVISAVDPTNADRVYLRVLGSQRGELFVSADGGRTFGSLLRGDVWLGFALSEDGGSIYVGGLRDGLYVGKRGANSLEKRASIPIACLSKSGNKLFACSDESSAFVAGESIDDGVTFAPLLRHMSAVRGPVPCHLEPSETTTDCESDWADLQERFAASIATSDAGLSDVALPPPSVTPTYRSPSTRDGCDFSTGQKRSFLGLWTFMLLAATVLGRLRKRA